MSDRDFIIDRDMVFQIMKRAGMTERMIADALGCSAVNVCKWLDDRHAISLNSVQRLAGALDVPVRMIIKRRLENAAIEGAGD